MDIAAVNHLLWHQGLVGTKCTEDTEMHERYGDEAGIGKKRMCSWFARARTLQPEVRQ